MCHLYPEASDTCCCAKRCLFRYFFYSWHINVMSQSQEWDESSAKQIKSNRSLQPHEGRRWWTPTASRCAPVFQQLNLWPNFSSFLLEPKCAVKVSCSPPSNILTLGSHVALCMKCLFLEIRVIWCLCQFDPKQQESFPNAVDLHSLSGCTAGLKWPCSSLSLWL